MLWPELLSERNNILCIWYCISFVIWNRVQYNLDILDMCRSTTKSFCNAQGLKQSKSCKSRMWICVVSNDWIDYVLHEYIPFSILHFVWLKNENEYKCIVTFFSFEIKQSFHFLRHFIFRLIFQQTFIFFDIRDIFYSRETKSCMVSIWWCMKNRVVYRANIVFGLFSFRFGRAISCLIFAGCSFLLRRHTHFNWFQYFILLSLGRLEKTWVKNIFRIFYFLFVRISAKDFELWVKKKNETDATAPSQFINR